MPVSRCVILSKLANKENGRKPMLSLVSFMRGCYQGSISLFIPTDSLSEGFSYTFWRRRSALRFSHYLCRISAPTFVDRNQNFF